MAQSLRDELLSIGDYKWGERDCLTMLELIYKDEGIQFRNELTNKIHARSIAEAKSKYGNLMLAYDNELKNLGFKTKKFGDSYRDDVLVFITWDDVILNLVSYKDNITIHNIDLQTLHGALLGVYVDQQHIIYQADGFYRLQNYVSSVYKYMSL